MSTFQYYEFQAIDRPLAEEEQQAVAGLSSRVDPHPWRAVFVYHWSNFRGDPVQVLTRYYDAMLYLANWGSRQLAFRFPRAVLDVNGVLAYCQPPTIQHHLSCTIAGEYLVLNIQFDEEGGDDWAEEEGWLSAMIGLRDDILRGDYRALYLAWLKTLDAEDLLDSVPEPPVPPELTRLTPALRRFVQFFGIDRLLVEVGAEASGDRTTASNEWLGRALALLPGLEREAFLLRLAQGEAHLSAALNRRLHEIAPEPEPRSHLRRTAGQLQAEVRARRARDWKRRAAEAEARRIRGLEHLAENETWTWGEVDRLIQQGKAGAYDEAVQLLVKLRELARYQGEGAAFQQRVNRIREQYARRPALLGRLDKVGLHRA